MSAQKRAARRARNWDRAIAIKLATGLVLAAIAAPIAAIAADLTRVAHNRRRWAK